MLVLKGDTQEYKPHTRKLRVCFWWKKMNKDIQDFNKNCDAYAHYKYEIVATPGLLQPLLV